MIARILVPWLLTIIVAAVGFLISMHQYRRLRWPKVYLAYCAGVGLIQMTCWFKLPNHYNAIFWFFQLAHDVLLCWLSVEIISVLLPARFVKFWATAFLVILLAGFFNTLPATTTAALLNLSISASYTGGLLLVALFFINVNWTKEDILVAAGVVTILLSHIVSSLQWMKAGLGIALILIIQLVPLIGLILMIIAGSSRNNRPLGKAWRRGQQGSS